MATVRFQFCVFCCAAGVYVNHSLPLRARPHSAAGSSSQWLPHSDSTSAAVSAAAPAGAHQPPAGVGHLSTACFQQGQEGNWGPLT